MTRGAHRKAPREMVVQVVTRLTCTWEGTVEISLEGKESTDLPLPPSWIRLSLQPGTSLTQAPLR